MWKEVLKESKDGEEKPKDENTIHIQEKLNSENYFASCSVACVFMLFWTQKCMYSATYGIGIQLHGSDGCHYNDIRVNYGGVGKGGCLHSTGCMSHTVATKP